MSRPNPPPASGSPAGPAGSSRGETGKRLGALGLAALVFALASFAIYGELWRHGASSFVPVSDLATVTRAARIPRPPDPTEHTADAVLDGAWLQSLSTADVTFEAWLVARNARALVTHPQRLFDAEHCAPARKTLTLGVPMITLGVLAIPAYLATGEPILTYNITLVVLSLLGAFAMYALVVGWTGVPAAGIAAGLLFGFQTARLEIIVHPAEWDATWMVLGLFFAERLTSRGRWRDAAGLGLAIALQIAASFYTLLGAAFAVVPFGAWLLWRDRMRHVSVGPLVLVLVIVAAATVLVLGPYLQAQTDSETMRRTQFLFAPLADYLPGAAFFPGVSIVVLALLALFVRREKLGLRLAGDPRWVLLAGAVLVVTVAAGDTTQARIKELGFEGLAAMVPDLYTAFASVLPGLDAIRVVERLSQGAYVLVTILAALGAACVIRNSGRYALLASILVVGVAAFEVLRAPSLGFPRRYGWIYENVRPSEEEIAFFRELAIRGNSGPIFEVPVTPSVHLGAAARIMRSAYHWRPTSACFGSFHPPGREELAELAAALPRSEAIDRLRELGFTTVLWHHGDRPDPMLHKLRVEGASRFYTGRIHATQERSAYTLKAAEEGDGGREAPTPP